MAGARTEQIAEAAGVNKALLYYYFNSKQALYDAALESVADRVVASSIAAWVRSARQASAWCGSRSAILTAFTRNTPFRT